MCDNGGFGVGEDGVSHAHEDGVSHARKDGVLHTHEEAVNVRSGIEYDKRSGALCARRKSIDHNSKSGVLRARISGVNVLGNGNDHDGVVMIENLALSFSFSCAETRNNVEDDCENFFSISFLF